MVTIPPVFARQLQPTTRAIGKARPIVKMWNEAISCHGYHWGMSTDAKELIQICEQLPEAKRVEVADFARFLLAREGDERWEQIIASSAPRPKLDEFLKESRREPGGR